MKLSVLHIAMIVSSLLVAVIGMMQTFNGNLWGIAMIVIGVLGAVLLPFIVKAEGRRER